MKLSLGKCWGLLIFDIIGLAISGYAFLLGYQMLMTLANANAYIILMGFFVGIKVIVIALYDLNRHLLLKNVPFVGAAISIIGNGVIFAMCFFLIPEVPMLFFAGLAVADFLMIALCHFLWWVLIGKDNDNVKEKKLSKNEPEALLPSEPKQQEKQQKLTREEKKSAKKVGAKAEKKKNDSKKNWLSRDDEEESEYDSIFTSLLENEKKGQQRYVESPKAVPETTLAEEKRYETSDYLKDIRENLKKDKRMARDERAEADLDSVFSDLKIEEKPLEQPGLIEILPTEFSRQNSAEPDLVNPGRGDTVVMDQGNIVQDMPKMESTRFVPIQKSDDLFAPFPDIIENRMGSEPLEAFGSKARGENESSVLEGDEDFSSIERRLGYLFYEIEKSMKETQYLQNAVSQFQKEVENYVPIAGDEKIVAAGNLIREKLKMIIDKQFVVDEVLDDLIRLSKLINKRINDLDRIEEGLNQRKTALDQKDKLFTEARNRRTSDAVIEILPEEVVIENLDSEFIVAEGDYDRIRQYLTQNPDEK